MQQGESVLSLRVASSSALCRKSLKPYVFHFWLAALFCYSDTWPFSALSQHGCAVSVVHPSEDFLEEVTTELEEFPGISQAEAVSKGDRRKGKEQGQGIVRCGENMASSEQPLSDVAGAAGRV